MASYTTYLFLPGHIAMWVRLFDSYVYGSAALEGESLSEAQVTATEGT